MLEFQGYSSKTSLLTHVKIVLVGKDVELKTFK